MNGYNTSKFNGLVINYATQEMVISDYGRGIYVADLEHPSDRYFDEGFKLKEISHVDGRRTIGIDTKWTIPLYYHYEWKVNDVKVENNPYQYLTHTLKKGDRVQLKLTLRESPDVTTTSAEYTVEDTTPTQLTTKPGKTLYSDGSGMIDLGYVDYFFKDFTIDMWVKPVSEGVILCNRAREYDKGSKGWLLAVEGKNLIFRYSPANMFYQPTYEETVDQQFDVDAGAIDLKQWHHIAVTQQRHNGKIAIYVDGVKRVESERKYPDHSLNNAMNLGLFADGYERSMMAGYADELKIWNRSLSDEDVRRSMLATNCAETGLVYYNSFNGTALTNSQETFSTIAPRIRKRANSQNVDMPVYVCAEKVEKVQLTQQVDFFNTDKYSLSVATSSTTLRPELHACRYRTSDLLEYPSNLDRTFYEISPSAFQLKAFEEIHASNDIVSLTFGEDITTDGDYHVYAADIYSDKKYWYELGKPTVDEVTGKLTLTNVSLKALQNQMLVLVKVKQGIELRIPEVVNKGKLYIYNEGISELDFNARIHADLTEPLVTYSITSNNDVLQPVAPLEFTKGNATGKLRINSNHAGGFNNMTPVTLTGEDNHLIPLHVDVVNRVTSLEAGQSALIEKGGLQVGNTEDFESIKQTNEFSMMTWVRLDDADLFSKDKPLMMFRDDVTTAIYLYNGELRCQWNNETWYQNQATGLTLTADKDKGKWVHVALVAQPTGIDLYLNGTKATITSGVSKTLINSPLMLGQNYEGDTWFSGAFDHAAVWNRSLTQEEVIHYMHNRAILNDPNLVTYATMDYIDENGNLFELVNNSKIVEYGKVQKQHHSPAPFNATTTYSSDNNAPFALTGTSTKWYLTQFDSAPYNWVSKTRSDYRPLKECFYTLVFAKTPTFEAEATEVELTINDVAILGSDELHLAIRPLGSEGDFATFLPASTVENGKAVFSIAPSEMKKGLEMMLFAAPNAQKRPIVGSISLDAGMDQNIILAEGINSFDVNVKFESINPDDEVLLTIKEKHYATPSISNVAQGGKVTIQIDRNKINKTGWNTVTLQLAQAQAQPLEVKVALEPKVELRLKNGVDAHHFKATSSIATLEVDAELVEGIFDGNVELVTTADMHSALDVDNGTLLTNREVAFNSLEHHKSNVGKEHEGWNLIGNPYLMNINLTKYQNVEFDKMTKFVYVYNGVNYEVSDMTDYDETHAIMPFRSYFVQTLSSDAEFNITPIAKQTKVNRRVLDHYTANERTYLRLQLQDENGVNDRTDILIDEASNAYFVVNEDAPKMQSMMATANQLFSLANGKELAINTLPYSDGTMIIPLGLAVGTTGNMQFSVAHLSGFASGELKLVDHETGKTWIPEVGETYDFSINKTGDYKNRFSIQIERNITGIDAVRNYEVTVDAGICTILGLGDGANIRIYDTQGRIVDSADCTEDTYSTRLQPGSYLVKIVKQQKEYVTKIIVR